MFESLVFVLFVALIVNDWLLARYLRKALTLGRFACPALEDFGVGGSPMRLLWRLRALPAPSALPDPELVAIRWQYRLQLALIVFMVVAIAARVIVR